MQPDTTSYERSSKTPRQRITTIFPIALAVHSRQLFVPIRRTQLRNAAPDL